jgi:molybdopterin-guanine dinucleotide biosynthesis protein A
LRACRAVRPTTVNASIGDAERVDWCAIVLAGGRGSRLGDVDKATLRIGADRMLDLVLAGLPDTARVLVAGPTRTTSRLVEFVADQTPFGGPVAGLASCLPLVREPAFALLAVDMPDASPSVAGLVDSLTPDIDAVVPLTPDGHRQPLAAVYRTAGVRSAIAALDDPFGTSMRRMLGMLRVRDVPTSGDHLTDVDTPEDLARRRER